MPNFGEALYDLPFDLKSNFRKLENSYKKHIMSKWFIVFNETCLKDIYIYINTNKAIKSFVL